MLEEIFEEFDRRGGRWVPTWSWPAFLFGPPWYIAKGMWVKGLLYFMVFLSLLVGVMIFLPPAALLVGLFASLYCALFFHWDLYRHRQRRARLR